MPEPSSRPGPREPLEVLAEARRLRQQTARRERFPAWRSLSADLQGWASRVRRPDLEDEAARQLAEAAGEALGADGYFGLRRAALQLLLALGARRAAPGLPGLATLLSREPRGGLQAAEALRRRATEALGVLVQDWEAFLAGAVERFLAGPPEPEAGLVGTLDWSTWEGGSHLAALLPLAPEAVQGRVVARLRAEGRPRAEEVGWFARTPAFYRDSHFQQEVAERLLQGPFYDREVFRYLESPYVDRLLAHVYDAEPGTRPLRSREIADAMAALEERAEVRLSPETLTRFCADSDEEVRMRAVRNVSRWLNPEVGELDRKGEDPAGYLPETFLQKCP